MKSKFSYKSKRTIIIAAIITVLLAGTATGVYFFTKGNAQAQAAGDNNTTQEQYGEAPEENKNEQQNNTTENEQNKNEQGETTLNQQEEQETERQEQTTNNNQTTQNEQTTTTTTGEVPNQEYVTEREETVKNPWETLEVGWGPTQFASIASTANLTAKKSNLEIHKTVDKESVKIGDTLTYTISVKNNGDKVAKAIIYDNVPEGTVLLNKDNNEDENTKKLTWRVTVEPGETEKVEFTVRVKAEKGTIKNSAIINGKTTNETETGIINITGKKEVNTSEAKVGDTLTYTITLTNSGNATGTVTVTDEIPAGTTLVEKSITNNGVESNGTITWTDVEVKAGDTVEVSFKVTINSDTKTSVTNKAVIDGNKPTEEVETKVANITGAKSVDKSTAKVGDTLTYTIILTNSGNADGTVTVTDEIPTGTTLVADSITANGSYNEENKTITWTDVKVEAGKTAEVSFKVTINNDTKTSVTNKAVIDGNKPTEEVETRIANITGAKSVDKPTAKVGDTLTYTITLTNNGNADGTVTVTDEIPTGTRIKDENTTGYNKATNTMTWSNVEVKANGGTATLTLEVVVKDDTTDTVKNVAKIDNKEIPEKPETKVANITGVKSVDKSNAKVGDTLIYTITLTNNGNGDGTVTVTDPIPDGTRIKDENTTGYNKATNTMIWSDVEVKAGKSVELTLEVVVEDNTSVIKNKAYVDDNKIPEEPETAVKHHYTVEHYTENLDGTYSKVEKDTVVSEDVEIGTKVTYEANKYDGFTFDDSKTENKDATVPDNNNLVIKLYYTRRNDLSYTVYYKEQGTENELADAKVVDGKTFGDVVTENAIDIDGYNKVDPTSGNITITTGTNEYTFYYTKRADLSYTVYYKEQGTENELADAKVVDGKTFGDVVTENAIDIDGYNKVNPTSGNITITTGKNEYTFYYTKRTDLSYTVNYYYNGKLGFREYFDNMEYLYEISGVDPKPEYNGVTYTKYDLKTSSENGLLPLIIGTGSNYINVYYGTPNVTISKKVNETAVKVGDTLHYTIKVTETRGLVDASGINVTDPIPEGLENVRNITHNGNLNEGNVEWNNLTITKNSSITLEFDATVSATTIGKTISNTANLGGTTSGDSNTVTTTVSELKAAVKEIKKGTTGKDAVNVVLVMDLSYSMQEKKTTDNVTRLEAAKKAATKFINSIYTKDPNSKVTVTVLTFNTKNPVTGIVGKTECTAWHNHDRHGCKKINGVWYSDWEETTETLPYSGTLKLGFADKTNYSSLVSKIEEITLPDSNPSYNYGWNTTGLGTNVYEALQLTESTVKELETNHSENSNVVILLSDGAPTTSYSGNSSWNEYEELRNKASEIKGNPITTEFYSIQFGTEDGAYGLLQAMSSNNSVYTSNSIDTLVENFTNILEQNITKDPIDTVNGKYTTTLSNPLVVDADNPITVTYEGTTLFTCTSLPSNGLTYDSTTKTISWDINAWNAVEGHPKVTTNNIVIQCYVER